MRDHLVVIGMLAGCGRIGFDPLVPIGHDEDGDGVADVDDVCPHLAGSQLDRDGDRVGDDCDPNPTVARDMIAVFATMMPGDQPFKTTSNDGTWTQLEDAWQFTGVAQPDDYLNSRIDVPLVLGDVRAAIGVDVLARIDPANQHQIALFAQRQPPEYFVELNEVADATVSQASVTFFDGTNYTTASAQELAGGIHVGAVTLQTTQRVGIGVRLDGGWPGELYTAEITDALYQGATTVGVNFNNLHVEIRWLIVITSS